MKTNHSKKPRVAIFGKPRTGTGTMFEFFREMGFEMLHEPFHPGKWPKPYDIRAELAAIYAKYDGIKHLHAHVDEEKNQALIDYLHENGIRVIHMRREEFPSALSETISLQTGCWGVDPNKKEAYRKKLAETPVDIGRLKWLIGHYTRTNAIYDQKLTAGGAFTVHHNRLFNVAPEAQHALLKQLFDHLQTPLSEGWKAIATKRFAGEDKQNTVDMLAAIPNRAEIEREFQVKL